MENKTLYELMTDKTFIAFNDYLHSRDLDFEAVIQNRDAFNTTLAEYVHSIEYHLINWYEDYKDAD